MQRNGQRVTDAVLVAIILNTYGAVGDKVAEFLYAVAGVEAKRIIDEISMLAVLLSAEIICAVARTFESIKFFITLQSHRASCSR